MAAKFNRPVEKSSFSNEFVSEEFLSKIPVLFDGKHISVICFKYTEQKLQMCVNTFYKNSINIKKTFADEELISAVIDFINDQQEPLKKYTANKHEIKASEKDSRIDVLKDLLDSQFRFCVEDDFVTEEGEHYMNISFSLNKKTTIRFCLKRDQTLEDMINQAREA